VAVLGLLGGALSCALPAYSARAHANLLRSDPEAGAVLTDPPAFVTLEFSEPLDPELSKASLLDDALTTVVEGPGLVDPNDRRILRLELPLLPPGTYSVTWQARSSVDGHVTNGAVAFSVGAGAPAASFLAAADVTDPATVSPSAPETMLRWLTVAAAALTAGPLFFGLLVWRPAFHAWDHPRPEADAAAGVVLRRIVRMGVASFAALTLAFLVYQAWQTSRSALPTPFGPALIALLRPTSGWVIWLRLGLLGVLGIEVGRLPPPGHGSPARWTAAVTLGLLSLFSLSLLSHGAARGDPRAILADALHVAAMAAWIGGLLPLILALRRNHIPASVLVPRFSRVAIGAVLTVVLSGLSAAAIHVGNVQALVSTTYGRVLLVKTSAFLVLLAIGAINLLRLSPRLSAPGGVALRRLHANIGVELALGAGVLALAGLLTGSVPARDAVQTRDRMGFVGEFLQDGLWIRLWVAPARLGLNEFAVDVVGADDPSPSPQVLLRLEASVARLGVTQIETERVSEERYFARGSYLSVAGPWQIDVIVRRAGHDDVRRTFPLEVQPDPQTATLANPVPPLARSLQQGGDLYRTNCVPCHGVDGRGDGPAGRRMNPPPADLTIHTAPGVHPDGQLFEWISSGYPGSVMPAFDETLTEDDRWDLVNYIRTLGTP
jgi:copper transport protein